MAAIAHTRSARTALKEHREQKDYLEQLQQELQTAVDDARRRLEMLEYDLEITSRRPIRRDRRATDRKEDE